MSSIDKDKKLLTAVKGGNMRRAKAALQAGAHVDGSPWLACAPIVAATLVDNVGMIEWLLERGADPDKAVSTRVSGPSSGKAVAIPGERALHIAARIGCTESVRLLLECSLTDPNVIDNTGCTPLFTACNCPHARVEVVRLLLEAGADPALANEDGWVPLHAVAVKGHTDLVDMLYARAPATLKGCRPTTNDATPIFLACSEGNERMVSKLVSLEAINAMPPNENDVVSLMIAVDRGFAGVVRALIFEGGIRAVGGETEFVNALYSVVKVGPPRILRLLLMVDGEEGRSKWVNASDPQGIPLLHFGALCYYPATVSVLLEAGADEAARNSQGLTPLDVIENSLRMDDEDQIDRRKGFAIHQMLQRGPAYRARSWAWPSGGEADSGASVDGDTPPAAATAAAAAAAAGVLSSSPAVKTSHNNGVRIFRSKKNWVNRSKLFVRLVGRYCAKD